jgi:hypothetical protein
MLAPIDDPIGHLLGSLDLLAVPLWVIFSSW